MREAIETLINELKEDAKIHKEKADEAYATGDLGLSGFHKGMSNAMNGVSAGLDIILAAHKDGEE